MIKPTFRTSRIEKITITDMGAEQANDLLVNGSKVENLPAGWYALGFSQADFPTWFDVQFWLPRLYLPVLYR